MGKHYDYRVRISVRPELPEAGTLALIRQGAAESEQILTALQAFYGVDSALASEQPTVDVRTIALESIGILLDQVVYVAEQANVDLDDLAIDPTVLVPLIQAAKERRNPFRRRRRVTVSDQQAAPEKVTKNGRRAVSPVETPPSSVEAETATVEAVTAEPLPPEPPPPDAAARPRRSRMF